MKFRMEYELKGVAEVDASDEQEAEHMIYEVLENSVYGLSEEPYIDVELLEAFIN